MFVKVHKALNTPAATNKGSCVLLANYLEKEDAGKAPADKMKFFNHEYDTVTKGSGIKAIDQNVKGLGHKDNKFFMVTVNPSHKELQHLIELATGKKGVTDFTQLGKADQLKVFTELRAYTRKVMDIYAENFNRPNVTSGNDLVYFGRIETERRWKPWEKQVKEGTARKGEKKEGLNLHIHVVVSRNNKGQTTKLSPESRSRGGKQKFQGREVEQGFDHERFKERAGAAFREMYNYKSGEKEQYHPSEREQRSTSRSFGKKAEDKLLQSAKGKIKGSVHSLANKMLPGLSTEKQVASGIVTAVTVVANPTSALKVAAQKIIQIIKDAASGNEI